MKRYKSFPNDKAREAAAIKYNAVKDAAPRIVALGRGYVAERMVEEAERNRVSVMQDEKLSHVLHQLSVGDEIPEALYRVVAEILVFVYRMDGKSMPGRDETGMK